MNEDITWVGMDTHKASIVVAAQIPGREGLLEWTVVNEAQAVRRFAKKLLRLAPGEVRCCYEAGPCGFVLKRQLEKAGPIVCEVIAPSLVPRKPGEHIKTDKRDARKLVEYFRSGLLTEVQPPTEAEENVRDLCRCRDDLRDDQMRARHRMSKWLLKRGITYGQGQTWRARHMDWLRALRFDDAIEQAVFEDYLQGIEQIAERMKHLDAQLEQVAQLPQYSAAVAALRCFHGIDTVSAVIWVAELYAFERFGSPRGLMSFLGLVPSEDSSGDRTKRGGITKAGNTLVRRIMVEAAWHYRHRPVVGAALKRRRKGQDRQVIAIADKAHQRLARRFRRLEAKGKQKNKVCVAIARELAAFMWSAMQVQPVQPVQPASKVA